MSRYPYRQAGETVRVVRDICEAVAIHKGHITQLPERLDFYENIDQILANKLHGPMYYTTSVTCVYTEHAFYIYTCQSNPPISQFNSPRIEFTIGKQRALSREITCSLRLYLIIGRTSIKPR